MEGEPWDAPLSPYFDDSEICWSPCGKYIAYTCKKQLGKEFAIGTDADIYLYSVEDGTTKNLTEGMVGFDKYPVFSPDGSKIAWQSMETPGYESDKHRLFTMDIQTGEKTYVTKDFDQNADNIRWGACGSKLFFVSGVKATQQIYKADLKTGEITPITAGRHNFTSFSMARGILVAQKTTMSMAPELFTINLGNQEEAQITHINKNIYDNIKMGEVKQRWVKTTDGKDMLVWVVLPPNFDETKKIPCPTLLPGWPTKHHRPVLELPLESADYGSQRLRGGGPQPKGCTLIWSGVECADIGRL